MSKVEIYTKDYCPHCKVAKATLGNLGLTFEEFDVTRDTALENKMRVRSQRRTVPQIFIDDVHIGGNDDLQSLLSNGALEEALKINASTA